MALSARVQVLFEPAQVARLQAIAESQGRSVGALIRDAVERTYLDRDRAERVAAVDQMARLSLPVADWEQMERQSVEHYGSG
ncbi:MAG TPA: ribbon-helix-helix protein, CopG family [Chloroflexota bacterium]